MLVRVSLPPSRTLHATAPIRICDNGGWTDTWFAGRGKVFNIAVRPLVSVRVDVFPAGTRDARLVLEAHNYGLRYAPELAAPTWGPHPLLEAAFREIPPPPDADLQVAIRSDAPAGASTGTSAAVVVALLGALDRLGSGRRTPQEIAEAAHRVETVHLGQQSGVQDQLASAFGGVNFIEITDYPHAIVTPVVLDESRAADLERRLALIFLGRAHSSTSVHESVVRNLERRGPNCPELDALRAAAERARDAMAAGDFAALGAAMRDNTVAQAGLHPDLVHRDAWRVIEIARASGALGWKVNGAGGDGGSIALLSDGRPGAAAAMVRAVVEDNAALVPVPIAFSREGLRVSEGD
jgi:D-glycero-alpha-D-manno-heptose-7-phosphate kinase